MAESRRRRGKVLLLGPLNLSFQPGQAGEAAPPSRRLCVDSAAAAPVFHGSPARDSPEPPTGATKLLSKATSSRAARQKKDRQRVGLQYEWRRFESVGNLIRMGRRYGLLPVQELDRRPSMLEPSALNRMPSWQGHRIQGILSGIGAE